MEKISEHIGSELIWSQPRALQMDYELRDSELLIATLRFRSEAGTFAIAESAEDCWTFKCVGFLQTSVAIRKCGSETDLAVFRNNTWDHGGTLELGDGRKYPANFNFWATQFAFQTASGEEIIRYYKIAGVVHMSAKVSIMERAHEIVETPWMVILGWYLVAMMNREMLPIHYAASGKTKK